MTVSLFDAYLERASVARLNRIIDGSQSAIYAAATENSRRQLWNTWSNSIAQNTARILQRIYDYSGRRYSVITWNGVEMSTRDLVNKFRTMFGRRSVV